VISFSIAHLPNDTRGAYFELSILQLQESVHQFIRRQWLVWYQHFAFIMSQCLFNDFAGASPAAPISEPMKKLWLDGEHAA
jgi:hypothetical protein